ncbi:MAG: type II secretion system F family protein [Candidatus Saccharimonadales bacterium]
MGIYKLIAVNKEDTVVTMNVEANSRDAAIAAIIKQGYRPTYLKLQREHRDFLSFLKPKIKSKDLVIFTRQLSTMISAGVPLLRALNTLSNQTENKSFQVVLQSVSKDVQSGTSLGDSFANHPKAFSDVFINMVRAGESGGILDEILKRLAVQQEKNDSIKKKVKSAMTYPMVLVIITVGAFFGLMFFVIPQVGKILKDLGGPDAELPQITQIMLDISHFMVTYWYIVIGVTIGLIIGARLFFKTPRGRHILHYTLIKTPIIGPIIRKVAVARFARTFSSLIGAGVSVLETLRVTGNAIGNDAFRDELIHGAEAVTSGSQLSQALEKGGLFPAIVPQMLSVGEETGETAEVLIKVADFFEEEVDATIASLSSIIEPVMIVFMGGMVGLVAVSVMGPIASLSQNVQ